jgi:dipeptidase
VARRVPDDRVVLLPNVHIIGEVSVAAGGNFLASADLISYAVTRGWFDPNGGEPFSFHKAYGEGDASSDPRRLRGRQLVTRETEPPAPGGSLSFGVRPRQKMTVAAVAEILRDTSGPRPLSTPTTQEGAVFQLRGDVPRQIGCIYWRTTAEPSKSGLTPWHLGITETPKSYYADVDVPVHVSLDYHFEPPERVFAVDPKSAWWTFKTLQDLAGAGRGPNRVLPEWRTFERDVFQRQPDVERRVLELWKTDRAAAREVLTEYCADVAARARRKADEMIHDLREGRSNQTRANDDRR